MLGLRQGAAVWACSSPPSPSHLLLRRPLAAAVKVASFVVQLAQDHVVLEEKLVSHTKSAETHENTELILGSCLSPSESAGPTGAFQAYFQRSSTVSTTSAALIIRK